MRKNKIIKEGEDESEREKNNKRKEYEKKIIKGKKMR